jgi:hypothetical protein
MPPQLCPRCQRAIPAGGNYCWLDGTPLSLTAAQARQPPGQLPHEFVFPSGRACKTYDELVQACQEEWSEARQLLRKGVFSRFLASVGRVDLAAAAQKAQTHSDPDIALHTLLGALPASARPAGPRLDLRPRRLALGSMKAGEARIVRLTVANVGKGLLHGTVTLSGGDNWIRLVGPGVTRDQCPVKTGREQQLTLQVDTASLSARGAYSAKLTVITNGGVSEVPISVEVGAMTFNVPPFEGARTPRELAEKMKANPRAAVPLLENGEVARWFAANGWVYPVPFAPAQGVAAVQQFFEGMGLSRPPALELSEAEARYTCYYPDLCQGQVTLRTRARKWVYASAESDVPWMRVTTPTVSGPQQAVIVYEIDSTLMDPDRLHQGTVHVVANAGQRVAHRVLVEVHRPQEPFTRRLLRPFLTGCLLALCIRLLLAVPGDLVARVLAAPAAGAGSVDTWLASPLARPDAAALYVRHFVLTTWWLGALGGAALLWRRGGRRADILCGGVAGAVAGALAAATVACLLPLPDAPARAAWGLVATAARGRNLPASPWLWTPLWVLLAAASWTVLGGTAAAVLRLVRGRDVWFLTWPAWAVRVRGAARRGFSKKAASKLLLLSG